MRNKRVYLSALGLALLSAGVSIVHAETTTCVGTIGKQMLDNIVVPPNSACTLQGTRANGTVKVETGATLRANAVRINGNIQGEGARSVSVTRGSIVGGNIQLVQGQSVSIDRVRVIQSLLVDENRSRIKLTNNRIEGNLQAFQNTGGIQISMNVIGENLQCKENIPPPTGGGNIAGSKEDQCANL